MPDFPKSPIAHDIRPVDFERPPVVETAMGIMFTPLKGWTMLHFGLLWSEIRQRYPRAEMRLPAGSVQFEDFDIRLGPEVHLERMPLRAWFLDAPGNQLLQVQSNAFIRNWRALSDEQRYVHYSELRPLFEQDWSSFVTFLIGQGMAEPNAFLCQVTYINHFVKGREWKSLDGIAALLNGINVQLSSTTLNAVSFTGTVRGTELKFEATPGLRSDGTPIIQVNLNVTGKPDGVEQSQILAKLDECHLVLVESFAELTAEPLQNQVWRRIK